jgi:uncharacterized membrane protein
MNSPALGEFFKPERLLAFGDGVFSVAISLLVIDLRLPRLYPTGDDDTALLNALLATEPKLAIPYYS